jgi:perosamine synthetase
VLEDAAQAIGAKYKDKFLGNIFDFGGYSFYGNKIITTGEGGVVIFRNKKFLKKLYALKNHGREVKGIFKHKNIGYNFMFTEMQAAVGNIQLRKLNKILNRKKKIYQFYKNKLSYIKEIKFMQAIKENTPVYWFSNIITKKKSKLKKYLNSQKIQTRDMFLPLNRQPCFKNTKYIKNINNKFINSEKIFRQGLSLPSSYNLNEKDLTYVVKKIKYFFKKKI